MEISNWDDQICPPTLNSQEWSSPRQHMPYKTMTMSRWKCARCGSIKPSETDTFKFDDDGSLENV